MSKITINQEEVNQLVLETVAKQISERLNYNQLLGNMVNEALESNRDVVQAILNDTLRGVIANPILSFIYVCYRKHEPCVGSRPGCRNVVYSPFIDFAIVSCHWFYPLKR